jgi:translocation and assembly module TamA
MLRVFRSLAPAWMPAFFCAGILLLQGCSLLPKSEPAEAEAGVRPVGGEKPAGAREAFSVSVNAPDTLREYLERNLEIQRYRQIDDLGAAELSRLMVAAEGNARELLATLGYFTPTLALDLRETPQAKAPREVRITVDPGQPTRVYQVQIDFSGPIAADPSAEAQREAIRKDWPLRAGQSFTQLGWDNAKSAARRSLTAKRFPTGSVALSRADIDADRGQAKLHVDYRSGPAYRFGPLEVRGSERYDADAARRIARVPTGSDYDQQKLLDAQQRLASSGYYDSVFLTLDTESSNPLWASVIAQVREAPLQKVVLGVGFTTDSGPRASVDQIHNRMPLLGWRAVSKLSVDRETRLLGTEWNAVPDDKGWRWFSAGQLKSETSGSYKVDSGRLRGGLGKSSDHIDYNYFLQYDYAQNRGINAPPSASALSVNWGWTARYFDDAAEPTRGHGLALELGAGYTLTGERLPFTRIYGRWLGIVPLGWTDTGDSASAARSSRLQLRAEAGAVTAKDSAQIPSTLMFLTGGDTTVRGYGYRQIGTLRADGQIVAGRYMSVASVEWQRPFVYRGKLTVWESAVFIDAGAVADRPGELKTKVGVGVGARWRSPVGPVQADLAYGVDTRKLRLHLRLGFTF